MTSPLTCMQSAHTISSRRVTFLTKYVVIIVLEWYWVIIGTRSFLYQGIQSFKCNTCIRGTLLIGIQSCRIGLQYCKHIAELLRKQFLFFLDRCSPAIYLNRSTPKHDASIPSSFTPSHPAMFVKSTPHKLSLPTQYSCTSF